MKVICKENTAKNLDLKEVTDVLYKEYKYPLTVGSEYIVMGLAIYKDTNCLYYLVDDDWVPFWLPYGLFEISDKAFPPNWHIEIFDKKKYPEYSVFLHQGFYELCSNEKFNLALIERESEALEIYRKRKAEFKQWHAEREEARKFYPKEAKIYYSIND
jgi:hypothetical protein